MNARSNTMNLSHWNVAVDFTGDQASALAVGLDPSQPSYVRTLGDPLFQRMKGSYQKRKGWLEWDMSPWEDGPIEKPDMLESVKLHWWASQVEPGTWNDYCQWAKNDVESGFEVQRFTRQELVRWMAAINVTSIYQFDLHPADEANACADKLGSRTPKRWTPEALQELKACKEKQGTKAAAKQFGISAARVRQLLPNTKKAPSGYSAFNQLKK